MRDRVIDAALQGISARQAAARFGVGAAAWLSISALKARHQYVIAMEAGKSVGAQLDADA